ncbi:MAG: uracil phosphoribosyltransferase [Cyanobacteria bacterium P01_F01_bin.153]
MPLQLRVYVPPHPLIQHWLGVARDAQTPTPLFRTAMAELGRWLTYEALREWLPMVETQVETPVGMATAQFINPQVPMAIVPVLRAGLSLLEGMQPIVPLASVYHLGLERNEETLECSCYLNRLPEKFPEGAMVLVAEPMLATGGSIMKTMEELSDRGLTPDQIRIVSVVVAPPALQQLNSAYPGLVIYTGTIDEQVNEQGWIVPGLGDAGDRTFGT